MERKEKVIFNKREFINKPGHHSMAHIIASIVKSNHGNENIEEGDSWVEIDLSLADCSRTINLSIDYGNKEERDNSLYKVDVLINTLTDFRSALEKELKYQARMERRRNRIKEEKKKKK